MLFEKACVLSPAFVYDMAVDVCDHIDLGVARVSLDGLDVAAVEVEFIGDTGMPEAVENDIREVV